MSSHIWTAAELSSEARPLDGEGWRLVEAQHTSSTMKLTETFEAQALLERVIEDFKPPLPRDCAGLHYLLSTPFRYRPYPQGSRFRKAGLTPGVFYCSESPHTALAEMAFYRVLFYAESPATPWPANASEYTAFAAEFQTAASIDLHAAPFDAERHLWEDLADYTPCQSLEVVARAAGIGLIRYRSVRDPRGGANLAILTCATFRNPQPTRTESWKLHLGPGGVRAVRDVPFSHLEFDRDAFAADPRLAGLRWVR